MTETTMLSTPEVELTTTPTPDPQEYLESPEAAAATQAFKNLYEVHGATAAWELLHMMTSVVILKDPALSESGKLHKPFVTKLDVANLEVEYRNQECE